MPGITIYNGPSMIDGAPIFVAAVWSSKNKKTGDMLQTYVMRADMNPLQANKTGEDHSICGDCKHRGVPTQDPKRKLAEKRSCYVNMGQGPLIVFKQYQKGAYPLSDTLDDVAELGQGKRIRLGTYGDPAVVPAYIWAQLISKAKGWTGYTHQSGHATADVQPLMTMISADTLEGAEKAWASKYRTFRVIRDVSEIVKGKEVLCPASEEAGRKATCSTCMLCAGSQQAARSVAIVVHGGGAKYA